MDQIAAGCGVTKPIIYRHFGDRDGLVMAMAVRFVAALVGALTPNSRNRTRPATSFRRPSTPISYSSRTTPASIASSRSTNPASAIRGRVDRRGGRRCAAAISPAQGSTPRGPSRGPTGSSAWCISPVTGGHATEHRADLTSSINSRPSCGRGSMASGSARQPHEPDLHMKERR